MEVGLEFYHYIIGCAAVFLAGLIDAIAGGGGLISLPAYLMIGLPSHFAIGTNKLSSAMGTVISTSEYIKDGFVNWKNGIFCIFVTLAGAWIGSNLALLISEKYFSIIMIMLLTGLAHISLNEAAGTAKVVNLTSNITALVVFIINGKVLWPLGLTAGAFSIAGHFLGAKLFVRNGTKIARPVIITVLSLLFIKIAVQVFQAL